MSPQNGRILLYCMYLAQYPRLPFCVLIYLNGTVSQDFLDPVFSLISFSWSYLRCPSAVLIYSEFSQGFWTFKITSQCPMQWRVEIPQGPLHRGVTKLIH